MEKAIHSRNDKVINNDRTSRSPGHFIAYGTSIPPKELTKTILSVLLSWFACTTCLAQKPDSYRPKMAEFATESLRNYGMDSHSEAFGNSSDKVDNDRLIKAKIGVPIIIEKHRMMGLQLKYAQHQFEFDMNDHLIPNDLILHLNDQTFTSAGIRFLYQRDVKKGQQLRIVAGAEIKSDVILWNRNTTKYFVSGTYIWRKSESTKIGTGLMASRMMGLTSINPLFIYQKQLTPKWYLDLTLPKSVSMRYKGSSKNYFITKTEFRGWRYNLTEAVPEENKSLTLQRADLQFSFSWEHEIHDWLWFGASAGYNKNLRYFLAEKGDRRRNAIVQLRSKDALFTKFSFFIVPPRKLCSR